MVFVTLALVGLFVAGWWVLNRPFDPAQRILPPIYFSADWRFQPTADLEPRPEVWGGLLFAWIGVVLYAGIIRKDALARNLALWALAGGAIGFPCGQALQSFHAWHPEAFRSGFWLKLDPHMNWWNMMETTFGGIAAGTFGLGVWANRSKIARPADSPVGILAWVEAAALAAHVGLLAMGEFGGPPLVEFIYDWGLVMAIIPVAVSTGGRNAPYLVMLPITLFPIAGKTVRELVYRNSEVSVWLGWTIYFAIPLGVAFAFAVWQSRRSQQEAAAGRTASQTLILCTWTCFLLNFAFFRFPWPWEAWTSRTPNGLIFLACAVALTIGGCVLGRHGVPASCRDDNPP
jgi:hypothetical protein